MVGVVFLPCGHLISCVNCSPKIKDCPFCRQFLNGKVKTYMSVIKPLIDSRPLNDRDNLEVTIQSRSEIYYPPGQRFQIKSI